MISPFLAAVATMAVLGGTVLIGAGLRRVPPPETVGRPPRSKRLLDRLGTDRRTTQLRILGAVGLVIGLMIAVFTGWLVAIIIVPVALVGIPLLIMTGQARRTIMRLEAMEEWARSLSGVLGAGVGLEPAIQATLSRATPAAIRPEVTTLVARLRARWPTKDALRAFADDLNDPTGDAMVVGLMLASSRSGTGLAPMLDGIAERAAEDVRNRRRIEADLSTPRTAARWLTILTVGVMVAMLLFRADYVAPYGTPVGQVILVALLAWYVLAMLWMRQMAKGKVLPRILNPIGESS